MKTEALFAVVSNDDFQTPLAVGKSLPDLEATMDLPNRYLSYYYKNNIPCKKYNFRVIAIQ